MPCEENPRFIGIVQLHEYIAGRGFRVVAIFQKYDPASVFTDVERASLHVIDVGEGFGLF